MSLAAGGTATLAGDRPVRAVLGWDAAGRRRRFVRPRRASVDLDASCLLLDADRRLVDQVWFARLASADGSVRHAGDAADTSGVVVAILLDLPRVCARTVTLLLALHSFPGQSFTPVRVVWCRFLDDRTGEQLVGCELPAYGPHTAQVVASVTRGDEDDDTWTVRAIGQPGHGRAPHQLLPLIGGSR